MPVRKNRIPQVRAAVAAAAARGVARAGGYVVDLARQLAPVKSGLLRDSIALEPEQPALQMRVVVTAPYAAFVEEGTSDSPAQPFLGPAVNAISVQREIAAEIKKAIR